MLEHVSDSSYVCFTEEEVSSLVEKCSQDPGLPRTNPTNSFWQNPPHQTLSTRQSPKLPENVDVLIIGSGITSASVAHHLLSSNPDISVLVAEARTLTSGATGRNGGQILAIPYEGYEESIAASGLEATKALVNFRGGHLGEMVNYTKTHLSESAAMESEIRVLEIVDCIFDAKQWERTKEQVSRFLKDFPDLEGKWEVWEREEAQKVIRPIFPFCRVCGRNANEYPSEVWNERHLWCSHWPCRSDVAV